MNAFDKAISFFNPAMAYRRMQYRNALDIIGTSGYVAGGYEHQSMRKYNPPSRNADNDIVPNLMLIRARSRDLIRNSAIGAGVVGTILSGVIGEGIKVIPAIDNEILGIDPEDAVKLERKIELEFNLWAESIFCDTERMLNFYDLQELALRSALENGDLFAIMTNRKSPTPHTFALNLVEADVCKTPFEYSARTDIVAGVRKDEYGAAVSCFFSGGNYGKKIETCTDNSYKEIPVWDKSGSRQILHVILKQRVGQTRGVPILAHVMQYAKQIERYSEAELAAAVISGAFTVFIQDEDMDGYEDAGEVKNNDKQKDEIALSPGAIVQLDKGKKIETANPARPNPQYEPFVVTNIKLIGMGLQIPYEVLYKHFASSYSASQGAMQEAYRYFKKIRANFVRQFCQPIYERFICDAVANGRIEAKGFFTDPIIRKAYTSARWVGPAKGMIDEYKDAKAAELRISTGISTREEELLSSRGIRYRDLRQQILREREDFGLQVDTTIMNKEDIDETVE